MNYPSNAIIAASVEDRDKWLEIRELDITSTDTAALFSMSPYSTTFELYHRKSGAYKKEFKTNERMEAGNILEPAIAQIIANQEGWDIQPMKDYLRLPDLRIGSSFDFMITNHKLGLAHLEIKNVDWFVFKDKWLSVDGEIEAPAHIEIQVQHQMMVSGWDHAFIGVFVGGNTAHVLYRKRDEDVIKVLRDKIAWFWSQVDQKIEPPVLSARDAEVAIKLNQYAEPQKILDASNDEVLADLARRYKEAGNAEKDAADDKKMYQAKILEHIGDAEKVIGSGFKISATMVADTPKTIITEDMIGQSYGGRSGYRKLTITMKKD